MRLPKTKKYKLNGKKCSKLKKNDKFGERNWMFFKKQGLKNRNIVSNFLKFTNRIKTEQNVGEGAQWVKWL